MVTLLLAVVVVAFLSCVPTVAELCPLAKCQYECKSGYWLNEAGCPGCKCVDPCEYPGCKGNEICYPSYTCKPRCPLARCLDPCKSGLRKDYRGCTACKCVDPCEHSPCAPGETCESQVVLCFAPPCYPVAKCVTTTTAEATTETTFEATTETTHYSTS